MSSNINLVRGLKRVFLVLSIIWFGYFIHQSYRYLGEQWSYESVKMTNNSRSSEYRDDVCGSFSRDIFNKFINPYHYTKVDKDVMGFKQKWFLSGTDKIQFMNTSSNIYETSWDDKYCQFNFKKPFSIKERITNRAKKYFFYSLFPIPMYLLILFVVNGFRKKEIK